MALEGRLTPASFGAVVANPPYIKHEHLSEQQRQLYETYLEEEAIPRIDLYLAFLKLSLSVVEEGGFVCLVLPHAFLLSDNAKSLRRRVNSEFDVRCLVDLSALSVFESLGIYNILLILQKRMDRAPERMAAQIVRCQDFAGPALQACLEGKTLETPYYSIFEVGQEFFARDKWVLLGARELSVTLRLARFAPLSLYVGIRQGVVTGADSVFIRPWSEIERSERGIYRSFLPDRRIFRYQVPRHTDEAMFYPFMNGVPVDEEMLQAKFRRTWEHLLAHKSRLTARRTVREGQIPWWRPTRPRDPKLMLGPKIVCPHLMLTPRFAIDLAGQYVVTRSPFICPIESYEEKEFLNVICAILNSSVTQWFISLHAYKYRGGYNRVEVPVLRSLPVPDPSAVPPAALNRILTLVDRAIQEGPTRELEIEIDDIVMGMYDFTERERNEIVGRWE